MVAAHTLSRKARAFAQYQTLELNSRLEAADPHRLVAILYEELLGAIDVVARALGRGQVIASHSHFHRANSILIALEASLDFSSGGLLSETLAGVYQGMRRELANTGRTADADRLAELRLGIVSIKDAWASLRTA